MKTVRFQRDRNAVVPEEKSGMEAALMRSRYSALRKRMGGPFSGYGDGIKMGSL
jgi:hypothetical protein